MNASSAPDPAGLARGRDRQAAWRRSLHACAEILAVCGALALSAKGWSQAHAVRPTMWPRDKIWFPAYRLLVPLAIGAGVVVLVTVAWSWVRKRDVRSWWTVRALFVSLVLGSLVILLHYQPFLRLQGHVAISVFSSAFLFARAGRPLVRRKLEIRALRVVDLALFNVCIAAVATELGLRAWSEFSDSPLFTKLDDPIERRLERLRLTAYEPRLGFRVNSRGYYDEEPRPRRSGERLVVAVGDSFAVGVVPHYYHYTTVCERLSGHLQVYNLGINGADPRGYLFMLETDGLPLRPDAVVVAIFVGNDIGAADRIGARLDFAERWWNRDNILLYQVPARFARVAREERLRRLAAGPDGRADADLPPAVVIPPPELARAMPYLMDHRLEVPHFSTASYLELETFRAERACGPNTEPYETLFRDILELRELCGEIPLLIMVIPDEFQVEDPLWRQVQTRSSLELDRDRPQRLIAAWLEERGIPSLDLLPLLRAAPAYEDGLRHVYHRRDSHFNRRGNEIAGRALAGFLAERMR